MVSNFCPALQRTKGSQGQAAVAAHAADTQTKEPFAQQMVEPIGIEPMT